MNLVFVFTDCLQNAMSSMALDSEINVPAPSSNAFFGIQSPAGHLELLGAAFNIRHHP
jgi:hypothetical protein